MQKQEQPAPERRRNTPYETEAERLEAVADSRAKWLLANADKRKQANANWKSRNQRKVKGYHLMRMYGLTLDQYDKMYQECGGQCEICAKSMAHICDDVKTGDKACVDHCHSTGRVRGLLCHQCNRHMHLVDNHLSAVLSYLQKELS